MALSPEYERSPLPGCLAGTLPVLCLATETLINTAAGSEAMPRNGTVEPAHQIKASTRRGVAAKRPDPAPDAESDPEPGVGATPAQDQLGATAPEYKQPNRWSLSAGGGQRKDWLTGRAACSGSPQSISASPGTRRCRCASALMMLALVAKPSPRTKPSATAAPPPKPGSRRGSNDNAGGHPTTPSESELVTLIHRRACPARPPALVNFQPELLVSFRPVST
jgi:hypothetical protein